MTNTPDTPETPETPGTAETPKGPDAKADHSAPPQPSATPHEDAAQAEATDGTPAEPTDGDRDGKATGSSDGPPTATPSTPPEAPERPDGKADHSDSPQPSATGHGDTAENEVTGGGTTEAVDGRATDSSPAETPADTAVGTTGSGAAHAAPPGAPAGTGGGPAAAETASDADGAAVPATDADGAAARASDVPVGAAAAAGAGTAGPWPPGAGPAPGPWPAHAYGAPPPGGRPPYGYAPYPQYPGHPPYGGWPPRPAPPRPKRPLPQTPGWLLPAALAAGLVSALVMPLTRPGLGLAVAGLVITAAVLRAARGRYTVWTTGYGALACLLLLSSTVIDAEWVVSLNLVAAFGLASLAVSGGGRSWFGLIRGGVSVLIAAPSVPRFLSAPLRGAAARRRWLPILISAAVTVASAGLFGLLFASADPAFAHFAGQILAFGSLPTLLLRLIIFTAAATLVGAASLVALRPVVNPSGPKVTLRAARGVWAAPLIGLNLLFAAFIAVQVSMLFGGNAHVLRSANLTYAEYARQGFFQLATVSALVLGIVALAVWLLPRERAGDRKVQAVLLGLLCVLTLVVLTSAMHRLGLYTDMFGLTRLRASVGAAIGWIGTVFVLVLAAGLANLRGGSAAWLPRSAVLATGLALALFSLWNPDARIAESQVDRAQAERGADGPDTWYLSSLSADAVPALDGLPADARSCALREIDARLGKGESWTAWNASRDWARDLLRERPADAATTTPCPSSRWDTLY